MSGRWKARRSIGGYDKEERSLSSGETAWRLRVATPVSFRTPHVRDTHASFPLPFSLFLSFSSLFLPLSLSLRPSPSLSLLVRDPLALSLRLLVRTSVPLYLPRYVFPRAVSPRSPPGRRRSTSCPASSRRARSGTNRSAASGNDDAPIGTRRRRIDADERRF